ncbi:MAG TPA: EAL domain-containing protein, partial [Acidimicrobiales bacterium]|nr:EAL domain-containing protein [Acidimicrobiales bacterium]
FQFFVVLAFLTLYQRWQPFLLALVFVVLEHGIVGVLDPRAVYDEAAAIHDPWLFAGIHGAFVLAASFGCVLSWRLTEQQALEDHLTHLANRTYLLDWLDDALKGRSRLSTAVVFIDLDNFKDTNDGFGHETGDLLLKAICQRLRGAVREGDVLARIGGDEFAVGLLGVKSRAGGLEAAHRILEVFRFPFQILDMNLAVSASVGIAFGADEDCTAAELVRNADLAMYEAKRAGGERVREYEPVMHAVALYRTELASELRIAFEQHQFSLHYQPIFDLRSRRLIGTEALLRWTHPTRGLVPPVEFIPAAEQSGLIVPLGAWVLQSACAQTKAWQEMRPDQPPLKVSVNLSPRQLSETSLVTTVVNALADSGLEPSSLVLEITESSFIRDLETALTTLNSLKTIGIGLALDDFGTGYSSLSYLQRLPVDNVKIDRSFIMGLDTGGHENRIVRAIIDLARAMGIVVTAEGVETYEQLARLTNLQGDLGQGFLLGRPQPPNDLESLIQGGDEEVFASVASANDPLAGDGTHRGATRTQS